jgi:hypothetical protein
MQLACCGWYSFCEPRIRVANAIILLMPCLYWERCNLCSLFARRPYDAYDCMRRPNRNPLLSNNHPSPQVRIMSWERTELCDTNLLDAFRFFYRRRFHVQIKVSVRACNCPDRFGGSTQPPVQWVPGLKWPGNEAEYSSPISTKIKKTCIYRSTPQYAFMA